MRLLKMPRPWWEEPSRQPGIMEWLPQGREGFCPFHVYISDAGRDRGFRVTHIVHYIIPCETWGLLLQKDGLFSLV
jgi:hypothetical protein